MYPSALPNQWPQKKPKRSNAVSPVSLIVICIIAFVAIVEVLSIREKSLTQDEPWHFRYGVNILSGDSSRFVDGTMPITALNALPSRMAELSVAARYRSILKAVPIGRYVTIAFSLIIALAVFSWSRQMYGNRGAIVSLLLFALSPNIIAHARLITTDVYAAGAVLLSLWTLWRFTKKVTPGRAILAATALGISQIAKYICILLYPLEAIILAICYGPEILKAVSRKDLKTIRRGIIRTLGYVVVFLCVSILIINAGFLFNKTFTPLNDYSFRSNAFKELRESLGVLARIPLPLPYPYLEGIDWGTYRTETGKGFGKMYLLGRLREVGGFKGYYFFAYLFKVPIATQIIAIVAFVTYARRRNLYGFLKDEIFLLGPIIFFAIYFNFFFKLQIGIRHFLVVLPILHVFCGSLLKESNASKSGLPDKEHIRGQVKLLTALGILFCYQSISVLSYFPHYIPYFNELVWDRKKAYKILADSNIDWGQDRKYLERYLMEHPDAYFEKGEWWMKRVRRRFEEKFVHPEFPDSGKIVVSVNNLVGIFDPGRYQWLRENYEPVDHIGYSYLVFEVHPNDSLKTHGKHQGKR